MNGRPLEGTEELRRTLTLASNTRGAERWTTLEWLALGRAYRASGWDVTPDEWTARQVREALSKRRPLTPQWDGDTSRPCNDLPMTGGPRLT